MPTFSENLNNPNLFSDNQPGDYSYSSSELGKNASGQLTLNASVQRNAAAQRAAGGEDRRGAGNPLGVDDGGHLIANRYGGSSSEENLTAQDRNLNRGAYKAMENQWAAQLQQGDKVFVNVDAFMSPDSQRPTAYMGYTISEHTGENGTISRDVDFFSFNNESKAEQQSWEDAAYAFYASEPQEIILDMSQNTTSQYIWNDEKGELEPNPYYQPNTPSPSESKESDSNDEKKAAASESAEETQSDNPIISLSKDNDKFADNPIISKDGDKYADSPIISKDGDKYASSPIISKDGDKFANSPIISTGGDQFADSPIISLSNGDEDYSASPIVTLSNDGDEDSNNPIMPVSNDGEDDYTIMSPGGEDGSISAEGAASESEGEASAEGTEQKGVGMGGGDGMSA